jgi:PAS domain S-box-containing protein
MIVTLLSPRFAVLAVFLLLLLPASGVLSAQKDRAMVVVCDDNYPPYVFLDDSGRPQGLLVDSWAAWERATGIRVELRPMPWDRALEVMLQGRADVIDTIFFNEDRAQSYDFSRPYADLPVPVFFHETLGGIVDLPSLRGFTIGVKSGDAVIDMLRENGIHSLKEYPGYREIVEAAGRGEVRVFSIDAPPAHYLLNRHGLAREYRAGFILYTGQFHRAVRKGQTELLRTVEEGFAAIPEETSKAIADKWLGAPIGHLPDLRVLKWLVFVGGAGLVLLAGFVLLLRRQIAARTIALRKSESKLRYLFSSMTDIILVLDDQGRYVDIAPTRTDLLYRPPAELVGRTLFELFPAEKANFYMEIIRRALESEDMVTVDYPLPIDGRTHWFSANVTRFSPSTVMWVARDITDRKLAEKALRRSEERFRFILNDISHIAIQGFDEERRVILWNEASERLYGYSASEAMGRPIEELIIPEAQRDRFIRDVEAWIRDDVRMPEEECVLRHKGGGPVPVFSAHVMYEASAERREIFRVDVDLTPIRQVQHELVEARDRAEAASQAKSEFLANMSHEIRTPLNGVLGMLELLRSTSLNGEQREYVENAAMASGRLTRLLSDILDLSRIESNKLSIQNDRFSMRDLFDAVSDLFALEARGKGLRLDLAMEEGMSEFFIGDEHRLRQVLFNLVGNALKFTASGGVEVRAWNVAGGNRPERVLFTVEDSGVGIDPEQLRRIFEPFVQTGNSYVRGHQGAGLGLAIVKRLVELMGGSVVIDSARDQGTQVHFCLPLIPVAGPKELSGDRAAETTVTLSGLRVLLAEDDPINQLATRRILEKAGARVALAVTGVQAFKLLADNDFDVVLMDIQMPEMDGVTATRAIRSSPSLGDKSRVPIIALTAYAMQQERNEFLDAGMDACLAKPVGLEGIVATLTHMRILPSSSAAENGKA